MSGSNPVSNNAELETQQLHVVDVLTPGLQLVNRFTVKQQLGGGAQGHVYHVFDELLEIDTAIKLLPATTHNASLQLAQIRKEVNIARQLQHPNIVRVHDVFNEDERLFFTMSLIKGEPLIKRLQRPLTQAEYATWTGQLLDAVNICQQRGIFHGDIKPDNLLIDEDNNLILIDFGIGQQATDNSQQTSGHRDYSAPEVLQGGVSSHNADLFSVGKVLENILASLTPPSGRQAQQWLKAQQQFIARLTHPQPSQRFTTEQAVSDWHHLQAKSTHQSTGWFKVAAAVAAIIAIITFWMLSASAPGIPDKTLRTGIVTTSNDAPLSLLANLLTYPVEASRQLAIADKAPLDKLIVNLGLSPQQSADDRSILSTTLGLDLMLILDAAETGEQQYLVSVAAVLMPANQLLFETSASVGKSSLSDDLSQLGYRITDEIADHLGQPAIAPDLSYLNAITLTVGRNEDDYATQLEALLDKAPAYPGGWLKAAEFAADNGDFAKAQQYLDTLQGLSEASEYWLLQGKILAADLTDDLALALQASERLLSLYPNHIDVLYQGAQIYEWADEPLKAMALYEQALAINTNNPQLWFELARLKIIQGDISQAIANELTQALVAARRLGDKQAEGLVLNAFGVAHLRLAEYDQAERYFSDSLQLRDGETQPAARANTLANLANVASINGHFDLAEASLQEASGLLNQLGDLPGQAHVYDTLGFMYEERSRYQAALGYYKRALDIRTQLGETDTQAESMSNVAYMNFLLGDYSLADIYWNQAVNQFSRINDQVHLMRTYQNLALMSLVKGDKHTAARYLIKVDSNITPEQTQETMINQLFYSYLNFSQGDLRQAFSNIKNASAIATASADSRAQIEVSLWHGEMCLRITDWACVAEQIALTEPLVSADMQEYATVLGWLSNVYAVEVADINPDEIAGFLEQLPTINLPVTVELKILLDLYERLNVSSDSVVAERIANLIKPTFYQSYMHWLYLRAPQDEDARRKLQAQLKGHPEHWRNHLYLTRFTDELSQQLQQQQLQLWLSALPEKTARQYKERYF